MKLTRLIFAAVFAAVSVAAGTVYAQATSHQHSRHDPVGHLSNEDRAPAFSSPDEKMAPNGDRVSHYPPYYHPEHSGGRR
jgi:hypothetical protein